MFIKRILTDPEDNMLKEAPDWDLRRDMLLALIDGYENRQDWLPLIQAGLDSPDREQFVKATRAAEYLQIDTWEYFFTRLLAGNDSYFWYVVAQTDDPVRVERVLALAEQRIALDQLATGPASILFMHGPDSEAYQILETILFRLRNAPGAGWPFLRTGLRSPVTRHRSVVISALAAWGKAQWPAEAEACLQAALENEPEEKTRENLRKLLTGEPLEQPEPRRRRR
jgi:hypothetical protein